MSSFQGSRRLAASGRASRTGQRPPLSRIAWGLLAALAQATAIAQAPPAQPSAGVHAFHIRAGQLRAALDDFSRQSGQTVLIAPGVDDTAQTPGLHGSHDAETALRTLIAHTGLTARKNAQGQWLLAPAAATTTARDAEKTASLPEVTVSGSSLRTGLQTYPGSVSVIRPDELSRSSTPIEALASVPGVSTGNDFGRGTGQQFHIRGFGYQSEERVIVMQEQVRRSVSLFSNHISSFRADNDLLKRAEVVKGASSVQYGGGAIGGVVAMTQKSAADFIPSGKEMGLSAKLRHEHNNYREGYLAGAFAPKDKPFELLAYGKKGKRGDQTMSRAFRASAQGEPVDKVDTDEDLQVGFLQGVFRPAPDQRLSLSYFDYRMDVRTSWQTLWHPSFSTVTGPVVGTLTQRDTIATYSFAPTDNPLVKLQASLYHARASYDRGYAYQDNRTRQPVALDYENMDKRVGLRLKNEAYFQTGTVSHRLLAGLDHEKRSEDAIMLRNGRLSDFGSMPNTQKDFGLYGHLESSFFHEALVLQLGGRYDRFSRRVDHRTDGRHTNSHFSPRLGVSVRVANGLHLLGNVAETFRAPTPHETYSDGALNPHYWYVPNPALQPETAREAELGFSYARQALLAPDDALRTKFMYFRGNIADMIALTHIRPGELSPEGSPYARYENVARARRSGFEWSLAYERRLAGLGLDYSRVRQVDTATGKNVPRAFADKLTLHAHLRPVDGLRLGLSVNHWRKPRQNPASTVIRGTTLWYVRDPFTVVNLQGRWKPNPHGSGFLGRDFEVEFGINNVFDATYRDASNVESSSIVGKGRNIYLGAIARF